MNTYIWAGENILSTEHEITVESFFFFDHVGSFFSGKLDPMIKAT